MVTIKMVAKQSGYSVATVSKALNGASDVSAETAALIRAVASDMGYTPNSAARALKTTRSYNFGVLFEDATNSGLTHEFFSYILQSFKRRSEELGYDISFISNRLGGRSVSYTEHARYRNYDGVLIASVEFRDPAVLELASSGIPVVAVDYSFHRCGSILSDNIQGMRDLVSHVYSLGHRRIAFIHGELTAVTRDRITGFQRQCLEFGIDIPKEYIVEGRYHSPDVSGELTRQLMALPNPPTCILYPDDISYIGGFNALERMGLSVDQSHFYTSALATAAFLKSQCPGGSAYVIGDPGLVYALYDAGITMNDHDPDYVVVGETRTYSYEKIEHAMRLVLGGARLIGTNYDISGPTQNGLSPACRALTAPIELATGKHAYFVGKPNPLIMRHAMETLGCSDDQTVIVGDRMDTDIVAGIQTQIDTVLVLSGVTTREMIRDFPYSPTYVVGGVGDLARS